MFQTIRDRFTTGVQTLQQLNQRVGSAVLDRQLPTVLKGDERLDITFRDFVRRLPTTAGDMTEEFIPSIADTVKTTGQVYGEGIAYTFDRTVREEVDKAKATGDRETLSQIMPTLSRITWQDYVKKVGAGGLEYLIYKSIKPAMRLKLLPRGGVGALQGIGRSISEGITKDLDASEIIENAKGNAKSWAGFMTVAPWLYTALGAPIKKAPEGVKAAVQRVKKEVLTDHAPVALQAKYPTIFEPGVRKASIVGQERLNMMSKALSKRLQATKTGTVEDVVRNLPGARVATQPAVQRELFPGEQQRRLTFKAADYTKQNIKNQYAHGRSPTTMTKQQDNVDALRLKQFGKITHNIYYPQQKALGDYARFQTGYADKAVKINTKHRIGMKDGNHITDVLEYIPNKELKAKTSAQILSKYGELKAFQNIKAKHINAAKEYRPVLEELRVNTNKMRKLLGLKEIGHLDRYAPHLKKVNAWENVSRADDTNWAKLRDFSLPDKIANPHAQKRVATEMLENPEKNFFALYDRYVSSMGKDFYFNPTMRHIKTQTQAMRSLGIDKTARFWEDQARAGFVKPIKYPLFENLAAIRAKASIPANILWAGTVQPSSMAFTVKDQGYRSTVSGAQKWFTDPKERAWVAKTASMAIKDHTGRTSILHGSTGAQDRLVFRPWTTKWSDTAGYPIQAMERNLTGMSVMAGKQHGAKLGFKGKDLEIYASMAGDMSQSMYNAGSRPLILNNPMFRFFFPFQTFTFEANAHLFHAAGIAKAPVTGSVANKVGYRLAMAANFASAAYLFNYYNEQVRGTKAYVPGGFAPVAGSATEYALHKTAGVDIGRFTGRHPVAPFQDFEQLMRAGEEAYDVTRKLQVEQHTNMADLGKAAAQYAWDGELDNFRKQLVYWSMGLPGLAGANQVNKMIDGIIASEKEYVKNSVGAEMFKVEGLGDKTLAVLFGPWQTKAGKEYAKEWEELHEAQKERAKQQSDITTIARRNLKNIQTIPEHEERRDAMIEVRKDSPQIYEEMVRLMEIDEKDLSSIERKILYNFGVQDWTRAREIVRMGDKMSEQEWNEFYTRLRSTRIISDEVERQIKAIFRER